MTPPPVGDSMLELRDFRFAYRNTPTLDIPSVSVPTGAVVGVIGNNGAGKTTFARCLCGLPRKARGTVIVDGAAWDQRKRLKNSYLVMQDVNHQLFTESVEEVLIGMPGEETENAARRRRYYPTLTCCPSRTCIRSRSPVGRSSERPSPRRSRRKRNCLSSTNRRAALTIFT